jgi:hypothetical protein
VVVPTATWNTSIRMAVRMCPTYCRPVRSTGLRESARLLHRGALVVSLIVGVLGMHSLMLMGMPAGVTGESVSTSTVSSSVVVGDPASGMSMPGRLAPAVASTPLVGSGPHLSPSFSAVARLVMPGAHECLAVLVAAAVLLVVLVGRAGWSSGVARVVVVVGRAGRAPPRRASTLTQLSVLRV